MTNSFSQNDQDIVTEALKLGLSISIRARNGGNIVVKTSRVYKNNKRRSLSCEYTLTQSILPDTSHTTHRADEIARMAIDLVGKALATEAQRLMSNFITQKRGSLS